MRHFDTHKYQVGEESSMEEGTEHLHLIEDSSGIKRTGTKWSAVAHIITAVVDSGILSLAWSMAQLGWILGPISMAFFAGITLFSAFIISDVYRYPDSESGPIRNKSFTDAVTLILGEKNGMICGILNGIGFFQIGIAYTITCSTCLRAIMRSKKCSEAWQSGWCEHEDTFYMVQFGVVQILISQIPDFHSMDWLSWISAAMSFAYSFIGFGLGASKVIRDGVIKGTIYGASYSTMIQKTRLVSQALGDIFFSYPYSTVVLRFRILFKIYMQFVTKDTLRSPPCEKETMKKASIIAIFMTTILYFGCGGIGYAAFGDDTPGNLLTGLGFDRDQWIIDFANICVVIHLLGGYQVYSQPVFVVVDRWIGRNNRQNLGRVCFRTCYVIATTMVAIVFPYFNEILGLVGAFNFWPMTLYFPVAMWMRKKDIKMWTREWILLWSLSIVCLVLCLVSFVGCVQGLFAAKSHLNNEHMGLV